MSEFVSDPRRAARQLLADWQSAGLTHVPAATIAQVVAAPAAEPGAAVPLAPAPAHHVGAPPAVAARTAPGDNPPAEAPRTRAPVVMPMSSLSLKERKAELQALAQRVAQCQRCPELAAARTQTVFGVGNPEARVMFIGEAPGADEDAQGEPFVGRAGQLLNKIIEACGWKREDLYICNILRCRPPGNRNPTPQEAANCREYLDGQIRLVDPEYIVCWGSVAAQSLLGEVTPIGKLRQKWLNHGRAKVLCTYHPSYLLRNPAAKKPVWDDMKFLLAEMGIEPPA
jgi:uracil-DNA glycosylase